MHSNHGGVKCAGDSDKMSLMHTNHGVPHAAEVDAALGMFGNRKQWRRVPGHSEFLLPSEELTVLIVPHLLDSGTGGKEENAPHAAEVDAST